MVNNGILFRDKKKWALKLPQSWAGKEASWKGLRTLDSNNVILEKASSRQDRKQAAGREKRLHRWSAEESEARESITRDTVGARIWPVCLGPSQETNANLRSGSSLDYQSCTSNGLLIIKLIMLAHCRRNCVSMESQGLTHIPPTFLLTPNCSTTAHKLEKVQSLFRPLPSFSSWMVQLCLQSCCNTQACLEVSSHD